MASIVPRAQLISTLTRHEGLRLKPYLCTSKRLSIGIGRNLQDVGITREEAQYLLNNDIARCETECKRAFSWFPSIDPVRQEVLVMMCFNMGLSNLLEFRKMLLAIEKGDFETAAHEMLDSEWKDQVGGRAYELSKMMELGRYIK